MKTPERWHPFHLMPSLSVFLPQHHTITSHHDVMWHCDVAWRSYVTVSTDIEQNNLPIKWTMYCLDSNSYIECFLGFVFVNCKEMKQYNSLYILQCWSCAELCLQLPAQISSHKIISHDIFRSFEKSRFSACRPWPMTFSLQLIRDIIKVHASTKF